MQQLGGLDSIFVHAEQSGLPMHISSFSAYKPTDSGKDEQLHAVGAENRVNFQAIVDFYQSVIRQKLPILRSKLISVPMNMDQPYWDEDADFDIDYHMRYTALPAPGDWGELCSLLGKLHAQPLSREHPLWEAYVIDGLHTAMDVPEGCFGILFKVHHAIMDGETGLAIFTALHSMDNTLAPIVQCTNAPVQNRPGRMALLRKAYWQNTTKSYNFVKTIANAIPVYRKIRKSISENKLRLIENKPKTRFNREISAARVVTRVEMPLSDIRSIKALVANAKINDVALTIIGGAMRRYLSHYGELPANSLVASTPINVRSKKEENADSTANILSVMNCVLGSDIADPKQRLQAVYDGSQMSKAFAEEMGHDLLNDLSDCLYAGVASWGLRKVTESGILSLLPPANHTIVTNVAGIPIPFYLCGCELVDSFGLGPLIPNTGTFHTVSSIYDRFSISLVADRAMMPDPEFYRECMMDAFQELHILCEPHEVHTEPQVVSEAVTLSRGVSQSDKAEKNGLNNKVINSCKKVLSDDVWAEPKPKCELEDMISMLLNDTESETENKNIGDDQIEAPESLLSKQAVV